MADVDKTLLIETEAIKNKILNQKVDIKTGLSKTQIEERLQHNLVNGDLNTKTKSIKEIFYKNIFTLFNFLNVVLAVLVLSVGAFKNALFMLLIVANTCIGLFQELKSKKTIDKLSLLSAPKAKVIRNSNIFQVALKDIILSDIMILESGNQICADSVIVDGEIEVNESLLTGESDAILKKVGDVLLSGSYVISGNAKAQVNKIGKENYAIKITAGAKYLKNVKSEIMTSINSIIKLMTFAVIFLAIILFIKNFAVGNLPFKNVIVMTVAQIIGMIPEGLVLLTTVVFATSVIRLAKHKTLVQDLYCVETLARVNVLCLDKTGTITTGGMQVSDVVSIKYSKQQIEEIMNALAFNLNDNNMTFTAIKEKFTNNPNWQSTKTLPFNSSRKYSAITFCDHGTFYLGAGEFILGDKFKNIEKKVNKFSNAGHRVLTLAKSSSEINGSLPTDLEVVGLILLNDTIRKEAPETLKYFAEQGVDILIISGDNPITVSQIAKQAGLSGAEKYVDARSLKSQEEIADALTKYKVFGRVTPDQKLAFVKQLKESGNVVAMTGDGVNDVLALKDADCSVAMASGSDAARSVSSLVLLDNNFASLPKIVAEGRRSINNLQRSSSLFLIKTIYATIFAILFIFLPLKYPFIPIQLTLIGGLLSGIPSLILALEPNKDRLKGKFLTNAITTALPGALYVVFSIILILLLTSSFGPIPLTFAEQATIATIVLGVIVWVVLLQNCLPFSKLRVVLIVVTLLLFAFINITPYLNLPIFLAIANLFELVVLPVSSLYVILPIIVLALPIIMITKKLLSKSKFTNALIDKMLNFVGKNKKK